MIHVCLHRKAPRAAAAGLLFGALVSVAGPARGASGGGYDLRWNTTDGGSWTFSAGGSFSLGGSSGQPDAGLMTGAPYVLQGGFWFGGLIPSPVELSAFEAVPLPRAILFTWRTSFEFDHLGFHVERSTQADEDWVRVSSGLIEPPAPYQFVDTRVSPGTTYLYRLEALDRAGGSEIFGPVAARIEVPSAVPLRDRLVASRPNPFGAESGSTVIGFDLARRAGATLRVFDAAGRQVRLVLEETLEAGEHAAVWDGRNDRGEPVGSGVYFYRLDAGEFSETRALVRLR